MNYHVTEYISKLKPHQREIVKKLRLLIQNSAPLAEEGMDYGVPAFKINGHLLVAYAAFKQHVGLYPEPEIIKVFEIELKSYSTSKGAIRFKIDQPIPYDLIRKIVKYKYSKLKAYSPRNK